MARVLVRDYLKHNPDCYEEEIYDINTPTNKIEVKPMTINMRVFGINGYTREECRFDVLMTYGGATFMFPRKKLKCENFDEARERKITILKD